MASRFIGTLKNGCPVYDRYNSHLHKNVKKLLPVVLSGIGSFDTIIEHEEDFGKTIGVTDCVTTTDSDEIVYAQRKNRHGLTRFAKNRKAEETSKVTVVLKKVDDHYIVLTAYIGRIAGPEPYDKRATDESKEYWKHHALVYGCEETVPGTETAICPW